MSVATTTAIGIAGAIGAGASLGAGAMQSSAATNAANQANQTELQMYNNNLALEQPYRQAGYSALNTIGNDLTNQTGFAKPFTMSDFYNDPGYQFTLQQGNQAIQRSAAAQGGLLSGASAKAMDQYTTGLADQTYNSAFNNYLNQSNMQYGQLAGVANMGLGAVGQSANLGQNTANNVAANTTAGITGAANASASGLVGASNAASGTMNNLLMYQLLQNAGNQSGYGSNINLLTQHASDLNPFS